MRKENIIRFCRLLRHECKSSSPRLTHGRYLCSNNNWWLTFFFSLFFLCVYLNSQHCHSLFFCRIIRSDNDRTAAILKAKQKEKKKSSEHNCFKIESLIWAAHGSLSSLHRLGYADGKQHRTQCTRWNLWWENKWRIYSLYIYRHPHIHNVDSTYLPADTLNHEFLATRSMNHWISSTQKGERKKTKLTQTRWNKYKGKRRYPRKRIFHLKWIQTLPLLDEHVGVEEADR